MSGGLRCDLIRALYSGYSKVPHHGEKMEEDFLQGEMKGLE